MKLLAIAFVLLSGFFLAGAAHAQVPLSLPRPLAAHWSDYRSTEMDVEQSGYAVLDLYIHTGPEEHAMLRFTPTTNLNQVQGSVLYDTGLIWTGTPFDGVQPVFTAGDTLTGVLIPDIDELVLTDGSSGQSFTLCGPNAPKQNPSPASFADTKACGST